MIIWYNIGDETKLQNYEFQKNYQALSLEYLK